MSVKTKLARKAVKTTAKQTARGTASKLARKPFRSVTLLALGAILGGIGGWLIGRSCGGEGQAEPLAGSSGPTGLVTNADNSTEQSSETGAAP